MASQPEKSANPGVLVFNARSLAGGMAGRRLRRTGVCCAPEIWQERLQRLGVQLGLKRPVTLLESCLARTPAVVGYLRPVILMPVGLLAGLPAGQIELILLHELAHVRRYDYLVNLLQAFVESLLFYHLAVWWISGVIRAEREKCGDDMVVSARGSAHDYARALAALEQARDAAWEPALAATGGSLVERIRRLLHPEEEPRQQAVEQLRGRLRSVKAIEHALEARAIDSRRPNVEKRGAFSGGQRQLPAIVDHSTPGIRHGKA